MANDLGRLYEIARHVVGGYECDLCITIRLKTLTSEMSAKSFLEKFSKLAARAKMPIHPGRQFPREGLGKPKRFFTMPRVC
jgi:hypothetical protein